MLFRYLSSFLILSSSLLTTTTTTAQTCVELLASDPTLSTLNNVVTTTLGGLDVSNTVVWAPVDTAFDFAADPTLERIATNPLFVPQLRQLILNHAVAGMDTDVVSSDTVTTLTGETLTVTGAMTPTTVAGFAEEDITVLETVEGSDCVVYKIDGILTPAWWEVSILELAGNGDLAGLKNLTTVFNTIDPATLATASVVPAVTVFAPSDEGFAKLGQATAEFLLGSDLLQPILFNHLILSQNVDSTMIGNTVNIGLLAPIPYEVTRSADGSISLGTATITMPDVFANNGIVHVIDEVLLGTVALPEVPTEAPVAAATTVAPTTAPVAATTAAPVVVATTPPTMSPVASMVMDTMAPVATMVDPVVTVTSPPTGMPVAVAVVTDMPVAARVVTEAPVTITPPEEETTSSPVAEEEMNAGPESSTRSDSLLLAASSVLSAIMVALLL